jgi:hypothetical protein
MENQRTTCEGMTLHTASCHMQKLTFFFVVLGVEFRAFCLPFEPSPAPFCFIFGIGSWVFAWASLDHDPSIYASHVAGMTGIATMPSYWLRWGLYKLFAKSGFETWTYLCLPSNWDLAQDIYVRAKTIKCIEENQRIKQWFLRCNTSGARKNTSWAPSKL